MSSLAAKQRANTTVSTSPERFFEQVYTCASINSRPFCHHLWHRSTSSVDCDILAYGVNNSVCLCLLTKSTGCSDAPRSFLGLRLLNGHSAPVNCLRWIEASPVSGFSWPYLILVSLDAVGTGIIWVCTRTSLVTNSLSGGDWSILSTFQTPNLTSPNAVDGSLLPISGTADSCSLVLGVASDTLLTSWCIKLEVDENPSGVKCIKSPLIDSSQLVTIDRSPNCCLCLRSICLKTSSTEMLHLLLAGTDSGTTELWSASLVQTPMTEGKRIFTLEATSFGHTDWVRCVDITMDKSGCIFSASGGSDGIIRVWKICSGKEDSHENGVSFGPPDGKHFHVISETVLPGHTNWVTGLAWAPQDRFPSFPPPLLSSSMDKSLIIWAPPSSSPTHSDLWIEEARVGNIGGPGLGYLDCFWSSDALSIFALKFQGGLSSWHTIEGSSKWNPGLSICGHRGSLTDLSWAPPTSKQAGKRFRLLLTVGSDQTVRAHAPVDLSKLSDRNPDCRISGLTRWNEIARPQVHGYDMNAITCLSPVSYVSAGDEKVARVFTATQPFIHTYNHVTGLQIGDFCASLKNVFAEGAVQPTLGLSNQVNPEACVGQPAADVTALGDPPSPHPILSDDYLQQSTLWPETKKLYGHPYEIYALAAHPTRPLVASSCVASKQVYAYIILWNGLSDWNIHQRLVHHQLTVTQMSFSHDGQNLLAVSRDRTWSVWHTSTGKSDLPEYNLAAFPLKGTGHSRIIWSCAWSPDDDYFFTGSRDKTILIWSARQLKNDVNADSSASPQSPLNLRQEFPEGVTALDACKLKDNPRAYLLAVGLESGGLLLRVLTADDQAELCLSATLTIPAHLAHVPGKQVRRVAFEPDAPELSQTICLATGADDGIVNVYAVDRLAIARQQLLSHSS